MHASSVTKFNGHQFEVTLDVNFNNATLQVEDSNTHEKWETNFDSSYIEELTKKVGNFKKFPVFMSMLESAIKKTSQSVDIQILSYSDLEVLRMKKLGMTSSLLITDFVAPHLNSKKYLVLSFTDDFDRVHYPLTLSYLGVLDIGILQEKVKNMELELATYRNQAPNEFYNRQIKTLQKEVTKLKNTNQEMEAELFECRFQMDGKSRKLKETNQLKSVISNLERDLINQAAKHQTVLKKRVQENKILASELKMVKNSEKRLRAQVKNLSNELAQLKRSKHAPRNTSRDSSIRSKSSVKSKSRDSSVDSRNSLLSRSSRMCTKSRPSLPEESSIIRRRSTSSDRMTNKSVSSSTAGRKPFPRGSSRFDPTAYVIEKEKRRLDTQKRRQMLIESRRINEKVCSTTTRMSWSDNDIKKYHSENDSSADSTFASQRDHQPSKQKLTKKLKDTRDFETEASEEEPEVSEIDARLARLRLFMKELL